jgi:hypothetical protein
MLGSRNLLIVFVIRKNYHSRGRNLLLYLFIKRVIKQTVLVIETKLLGIISVDFDIIDWLLIRYSPFVRYWRKNGSVLGHYITYLWILRRPVT